MSKDRSEWEEVPEPPSKSQRKREMLALQELGRQLTALKPAQLDSFPLSEDLREALADYRRIGKREARRRQLQYIGRLMRRENRAAIETQFEQLNSADRRRQQAERLAGQWRDRLLDEGDGAVTEFFRQYPQADHQAVRQLLRNARRERSAGQPPAQARKLFRRLRECIADAEL